MMTILAVPQEAEVSQIHFREISLQEMAERSEAVYLVRPADPFRKTKSIEIRNAAQKLIPGSREKYPPFQKVLLHFEVLEILAGPAPVKSQKKYIAVEGANSDAQLSMHKSYYLKGMSRSPSYDQYSGKGANLEAEDTAIIFVHQMENSQYVFTCENAILPTEEKKKILKVLKKMNKNSKDTIIRLN